MPPFLAVVEVKFLSLPAAYAYAAIHRYFFTFGMDASPVFSRESWYVAEFEFFYFVGG
jgi:hypothetical protein